MRISKKLQKMFAYKENDTLFSKFSAFELDKIGDSPSTPLNHMGLCAAFSSQHKNKRKVCYLL